MNICRNYPLGRGLLVLLITTIILVISGCSQPAGDSTPLIPVAPEAPVPEADEQPDPDVVLTAEAGAESDFVVGVGVVRVIDEEETIYSDSLVQGMLLAINQVNESAFLGENQRMALMIGDTAITDDDVMTVEEPEFLDDVVAAVGPVLRRGDSEAVEDVIVPLVLRADAGTDVFGESQYVDDWAFRTGLATGELTVQTVVQARERLGIDSVAVLSDELTEEESPILVEELSLAGIDVVATGALGSDTDAADLLLQVREVNPAAVVLHLSPETAALVLQEARAADFPAEIRFIAAAGLLRPSFLELAGEASRGVVGGVSWYVVQPFGENVGFVDAFQSRFEREPDAVAAKAYTAIWLLAEAVRQSNSTDPATLRDTLENLDGVETPLGALAIEATDEPLATPVMLEVDDNGEISIWE